MIGHAHFTNMTDEQRYQFTAELWMLWQMRYRMGAPLIGMENYPPAVIEREIWLAEQLGFRHARTKAL